MADNKEEIIVKVTYDTEDSQDNVNALTKDIVGLEEANKSLKTQLKAGTISQEDYSKAVESNRLSLSKNKAERKDNIKFLKAEKGSQDELQTSVKLLTNERKKLNLSTVEGRKRAEELNDQIDDLRGTINDNSSALEQNKNNIGNYKEGVTGALKEAGLFNNAISDNVVGLFDSALALKDAAGGLVSFNAGSGAAEGGVKNMSKTVLKFMKIPLILLISAIVLALKFLIDAVKRNEGVMDKFGEVMEGVSNAFEAFIGRVQRLVKIAGKLLSGQISLNEAVEEGSKAFDGLGDEMNDAYKEGVNLARVQKQLEENAIANTVAVAQLNAEYEKQSAIADDSTRSFDEMTEANKRAGEASKAAARIEADSAKARLNEVNLRVGIAEKQNRLDRKLRQEQADAIAAAIEAESRFTQVVFDNERQRREIARDKFEQELDFILDVADARKTANEKQIANDKLALSQRQAILDETAGFINESFAQQIALIEAQGKIAIDTKKLLELNNEEAAEYAFSLGLSEIATNRLLEVIRERIAANSDLNEAEADLNAARAERIEAEIELAVELDEELDAFFDKEMERIDAQQEAEDEAFEKDKARLLARQENLNNIAGAIGQITGKFLADQNQSFGDFAKSLGVLLLDIVQKEVLAAQIRITAQSLASPESVATFGVAGLVKAAAINGLITTAFTAAKVGIKSFAQGGEVKQGTFGGNYHSQGGNDLYDSSGNIVANVERDENFYVLKRDASAHINALSATNENFGGRSFATGTVQHAANGGQIQTQQAGLTAQDVQQIIKQTPIQVQVVDVQAGLVGNNEANNVGVIG